MVRMFTRIAIIGVISSSALAATGIRAKSLVSQACAARFPSLNQSVLNGSYLDDLTIAEADLNFVIASSAGDDKSSNAFETVLRTCLNDTYLAAQFFSDTAQVTTLNGQFPIKSTVSARVLQYFTLLNGGAEERVHGLGISATYTGSVNDLPVTTLIIHKH